MTAPSPTLVDLAFDRCLPHWGGEFAIALAYFADGSSARSPARDRSWLEFQIWKEWYGSGVYGPRGITVADLLAQAVAQIRIPHERDDAEALTQASAMLDFGRDEFAHFTILFELWRQTFGDAPAQLEAWGALPAGIELMELRLRLQGDRLGAIAVRLSEGGGLGLFFGIRDALARADGAFERGLVRAVDRILADERHHLTGNFVDAAHGVREPAEIATVVELLSNICAVKLREREQQFAVMLGEPNAATLARYREHHLAPLRAEILARTND
jgi:hypothetical protein